MITRLIGAVVGLASLAGIVLRFATGSPLWLDEALSVNLAALPVSELGSALRHDGHPALYYLLLAAWSDIFGTNDWAVRALSGVLSLLAVVFIRLAARRRFGPGAGRYATILALTSPFLIRYGSEARMYALLVALVAVGWWLLDAVLECERARPWSWRLAALAAVTAAGLNSHYWMIWLVLTTTALLALAALRDQARRPVLIGAIVAIGVGASSLFLWLGVFLDQLAHTGTPWGSAARPAEVAVEVIQGIGGGRRFEPVLLGVLLLIAALIGALIVTTTANPGRASSNKNPGSNRSIDIGSQSPSNNSIELLVRPPAETAGLVAVVVLTLGSGAIVAFLTGGAFEARYTAVVVPLLLALAARGLASLPGLIAPAGLALIAVFGIAVAADDARRDRSQGEAAAAVIDSLAGDGDVVVFCPDQLAPATLRYLDRELQVTTYPPGDDPHFVDWYDYLERIAAGDPAGESLQVSGKAGSADIWLVMMTGYRGFEGHCEALSAGLAAGRRPQTHLEAGTVFEPMFLQRFAAPS